MNQTNLAYIRELLSTSNHSLASHENIHEFYAYDAEIILFSNRPLFLNLAEVNYEQLEYHHIDITVFKDEGNCVYFFQLFNEAHLIKINDVNEKHHTINAIFGKDLKQIQNALLRLGAHGYSYFKPHYDMLDSYLEKNELEKNLNGSHSFHSESKTNKLKI